MKEKLFGNASWVEIVLIGVMVVLFAVIIFSIATNHASSAEFFARPISKMTIGEFIVVVLILGWLTRK